MNEHLHSNQQQQQQEQITSVSNPNAVNNVNNGGGGYANNGMNMNETWSHIQQQQQQQQQQQHSSNNMNTTNRMYVTANTHTNTLANTPLSHTSKVLNTSSSIEQHKGQMTIWQILENFSRSFLGMSMFDMADIWVPVDNGYSTDNGGALPVLKHVSTVAHESQNEEFISFHCLNCMVAISSWDGCVGQAFASGLPIWSSDEQVIWDFNRATMFRQADIKTAFSYPVYFAGSMRPKFPSCVVSFYSRSDMEPNETVMNFVSHTLVATVPNVIKPERDVFSIGTQAKAIAPNALNYVPEPYLKYNTTTHATAADRFHSQQTHSFHQYHPHELESTILNRKRPAIEISEMNYLVSLNNVNTDSI